MARPMASLSAKAQAVRPQKSRRWRVGARAEPRAGSPRRVRRARGMSGCRTSEFCFLLRCGGRNRSGWCSIPAARAGSYRRSRPYRDADTRRRVRPDRAGARTGSRGTRRSKGRNPAASPAKPPPAMATVEPWVGRGRHHNRRFTYPLPRMVSFSRTLKATRSVNTSYCRAAIFSSSLR